MKADVNALELGHAFALVCQGVRRQKEQKAAVALITFIEDVVAVEFNDISTRCPAVVSVSGMYALNPFVFRPLLETFGDAKISMEMRSEGVTLGRMKVAHLRVQGHFHEPGEAFERSRNAKRQAVSKRQKRSRNEARLNAEKSPLKDLLRDSKYVAFKRIDGGIEYGALILKYEKGELGKRNIYVKTKDFQEAWIHELEIVSYGLHPALDLEE